MWESLSNWEKFAACFIFMGSVVDVFQFFWIVRRFFSGIREKVYERAKKDIMLAQLDMYKQGNSGGDNAPNFPGFPPKNMQ